jgi:Holliday junction resolvasome RuvABC endonuclease subunit
VAAEDHKFFIGIDPSINHTGWGIIRINADTEEPEWIDSGIIKPKEEGHTRLIVIAEELWRTIDTVPSVEVVVVEQPTFENSSRGRTCAATKGLNKLYFAAGACVGAVAISAVPLAFITAWQWKGQVPKGMIKDRVNAVLRNVPHRLQWEGTDEWEALGLALWGWRHQGEYEVFT